MRFQRPTSKPWLNLLVFAVIFAAIFGMMTGVSATNGNPPSPGVSINTDKDANGSTVARMLTWMLTGSLTLLGPILNAIVSAVVWVSSYNDFINSLAVVNGWVVVRDVANMFFIVVLLIIGFGTILGQEEYHYKKLLPKLLILAVLVNFSRTIVGVLIDFAQVIMLTFVNGYAQAAGGNFSNLFQIVDLLKFSQKNCDPVAGANPSAPPKDWQIFGAALLAFIMVLVSLVTVFIILAVLVLRVIMLWLLTVLSPIAFLAGTFPQGQKYYQQWWEEFKNQVMVGPMLAFFLWLSLITVGGGNAASHIAPGLTADPDANVKFACSEVGNTEALISYVLGIMMLLTGVQMAQQMGGAIAGVAGRAKTFAARTAPRILGGALGLGYKAVKPAAAYGVERASAALGVELRPSKWKEAYKNMRETSKIRRERQIAATAEERIRSPKGWKRFLAIGGAPQDFLEHPGAFMQSAFGKKEKAEEAQARMAQVLNFRKKQKDFQLMSSGGIGAYSDMYKDEAKTAGRARTDNETSLQKYRQQQWKEKGKEQDKVVKDAQRQERGASVGLKTELSSLTKPERERADQALGDWDAARESTENDTLELTEEKATLENEERTINMDYEINVKAVEDERDRITARRAELVAKPDDQRSMAETVELQSLAEVLPKIEQEIQVKTDEHKKKYSDRQQKIESRKSQIDVELADTSRRHNEARLTMQMNLRDIKPEVADAAASVANAQTDVLAAKQAKVRVNVNAKKGGMSVGTSEEARLEGIVREARAREREAQEVVKLNPKELARRFAEERNRGLDSRLRMQAAAATGGAALSEDVYRQTRELLTRRGVSPELLRQLDAIPDLRARMQQVSAWITAQS